MNDILKVITVNAIAFELHVILLIMKSTEKSEIFQVTTDLLNSENLKITIVHLCNELQVCNFTMLQLTQK